jgi:hypothetical protein
MYLNACAIVHVGRLEYPECVGVPGHAGHQAAPLLGGGGACSADPYIITCRG